MTVRDIRGFGLKALVDSDGDAVVTGGFTSDLLSDVMGNAKEGNVLITIQAHKNTVAVASLGNLAAIIICSGRTVPSDMLEAAKDEGIALFLSDENQFTVSGRLWDGLKQG